MKFNLTDTAIRNAKPQINSRPKKYTDGGGLYLLVNTKGKYWRYKYRINGKEKTLALGVYPDVSLKLARERHQEARELLARGVDPSSYKQAVKAEQEAVHKNSFEAVAREWFVKFKHQWAASHADKVIRRLERDIFPWLGKQSITSIEPPDILQCLRRIEDRGALETAHRAKQNIGQVFRYAVATGRVKRDQTTDLKGALPPPKKSNFAAITDPKEIGGLLRAMDDYIGRRGAMPQLKRSDSYTQEVAKIVKWLTQWQQQAQLSWRDVCILYRYHPQGKQLYEALTVAGIPLQWLASSASKKQFKPDDDCVKLMTLHSSKGLEFPWVIISGLGFMPDANEHKSVEAKLLYVAMTRSTDKLLLMYHQATEFTQCLSA